MVTHVFCAVILSCRLEIICSFAQSCWKYICVSILLGCCGQSVHFFPNCQTSNTSTMCLCTAMEIILLFNKVFVSLLLLQDRLGWAVGTLQPRIQFLIDDNTCDLCSNVVLQNIDLNCHLSVLCPKLLEISPSNKVPMFIRGDHSRHDCISQLKETISTNPYVYS
jgi:hypothetical protein